MIYNGEIHTPFETANALLGITRDSVMTLAKKELGIDVVQRRINRSELYLADEVFLTGTAAHLTPVGRIDNRDIGDGNTGPLTQQLQDVYFECVTGTTTTTWTGARESHPAADNNRRPHDRPQRSPPYPHERPDRICRITNGARLSPPRVPRQSRRTQIAVSISGIRGLWILPNQLLTRAFGIFLIVVGIATYILSRSGSKAHGPPDQ